MAKFNVVQKQKRAETAEWKRAIHGDPFPSPANASTSSSRNGADLLMIEAEGGYREGSGDHARCGDGCCPRCEALFLSSSSIAGWGFIERCCPQVVKLPLLPPIPSHHLTVAVVKLPEAAHLTAGERHCYREGCLPYSHSDLQSQFGLTVGSRLADAMDLFSGFVNERMNCKGDNVRDKFGVVGREDMKTLITNHCHRKREPDSSNMRRNNNVEAQTNQVRVWRRGGKNAEIGKKDDSPELGCRWRGAAKAVRPSYCQQFGVVMIFGHCYTGKQVRQGFGEEEEKCRNWEEFHGVTQKLRELHGATEVMYMAAATVRVAVRETTFTAAVTLAGGEVSSFRELHWQRRCDDGMGGSSGGFKELHSSFTT
ncbi:hypothetical protein L1049_015706 [Liquidambar formosana]|uniref:Uncharacterized protein n=1 Tax=Liquidambar formosana TaxID=63359 RepID=A0AAP0S082_LIQFO